jgi:hypothetical protein
VRSRAVSCHFVWRLTLTVAVAVFMSATPALAQEDPAGSPDDQGAPLPMVPRQPTEQPSDLTPEWEPLGPAPVDQAGAGRRGYVLAGDDADVTRPGTNRFAVHGVVANNFYHEETPDFLITQRSETHSLALDYRRGFKPQRFPRFELGGQLQLHETDRGVLNGFIAGVENFWVSLTGYEASKNLLRSGSATPRGTVITRDGTVLYRQNGTGAGPGDIYLTAKAALLEGAASRSPRLAARIGWNIAGRSQFTAGNFVGAGLSLDTRVFNGVAVHVDARVTRILDHVSIWSLPLGRVTYGFSAGPEFRLPRNSSLSLQIDGTSTPYLPTGTLAFDKGYGDLTFALGHRYKAGTRTVLAQLYVRENMNLPFRVRWNTDPDMSLGLKISLR